MGKKQQVKSVLSIKDMSMWSGKLSQESNYKHGSHTNNVIKILIEKKSKNKSSEILTNVKQPSNRTENIYSDFNQTMRDLIVG